ncbi:MAG: transporter [Deltaproteobacteria bacterium]|nr:transporter [Deltaproteobacteria bacterium]
MPRWSRSTFARSVAVLAAALLHAERAFAQACCAGSGAVTPARLGVHEDALVGLQARYAGHLGSHDAEGEYVRTPSHAREINLEQNLFGAVRVVRRVQLSVLVPFVQTHRRAYGRSSTGGGIGDLNVAARWDPLLAGEAQRVPGVGLLAGVTFPTGRTAEDAERPMATDATGIGAVQANGGIAFEQTFGPWFVGVSGLFAWRTPRTVRGARMKLAPQYTLLASVGYAFPSGATAALVGLYTVEGLARVDDAAVPASDRRVVSGSIAGSVPLTDWLRVVASLFANPPFASLGLNQPVTAGGTVGVIWGFS